MFYSYNYCSISKSIFIQAFSPPPRGAPVSPTLRFRIPPFEGGEGGCPSAFGTFVIQSEAKNLFPLPREIPHYVRNDKGWRPNHYSFRLSALRRGGCPVSQRFALG